MAKQIIPLIAVLLCLAACGEDQDKEYTMVKETPTAEKQATSDKVDAGHEHAGHAHAEADGNSDALASPGDVKWTAPESWTKETAGGMRLASYKIPHDAGAGDLSVISLGGDGGGMLANINRWRNQVDLDPIGEAAIKTQTKTIDSAIGTFTAMTLVNDKNPNRAICGAVYFGKGFSLFVKLTASKACVEANAEAVYDFCAKATKAP